ncbi:MULTISPECIES: DUF262 domain-containing protein [unclassified Bradyrhizobium]|uniref:DUF262 domain-containing protein n=1 Tax=unclassified Bradyrhizobium TaxID=2631580 RepID=UPI00211E9B17|nr:MULTISPECIES: DUF262 domain-containing HNH endonuclease family protein [unclassified Bradyrhizobium]
MNIKPSESTIRVMFQSAFYKIPRFQRPYSWDRGNIEEFWTDVLEGTASSYFIGSMVFYKKANETFVVDGQQRLTTLTIFLAALRDSLRDTGEASLAKGIQNVIQRKDINDEFRYVLLTETSYPYFQDRIQSFNSPELDDAASSEEEGMAGAYEYARQKFREIVESHSEKKSIQRKVAIRNALQSLRDRLLDLQVIIIQLDNEDEAYIIFETLNTRGKDLAVQDLLKNHLARLLPASSADVDATRKRWNHIAEEISQSELDMSNYVHHFWLSREDYTSLKTLFKRIRSKIGKQNAKQFLRDLEEGVETYRRIFDPSAFEWSTEERPIARSLAALQTFRVRQPTPLVIALLRAHSMDFISLKQLRATLHAIESFHFQHTAIASLSSSGGISFMYAAAARDLYTETSAQKRASHLQMFRKKLCERIPEETTFVAQFVEVRFLSSDSKQRPIVRYILEKMDHHFRIDKSADYEKMTIEHIAPENPSGQKSSKLDPGNIGNLIFVSKDLNEKLRNKEFTAKKKLLLEAGIPLDHVLKGATQWTTKEITERAALMAKIAYERIWKP